MHYGKAFTFEPREIRYERRVRIGKVSIIRIVTSKGVSMVGTYGDSVVLDVDGDRHTVPRFYMHSDATKVLVGEGGRAVMKATNEAYGGGEPSMPGAL